MSAYADLRKLCYIAKAEQSFDADHGVETVYVVLEDLPGIQGFGGCMHDKAEGKLFMREICEAFGVRDPEALEGMQAVALYTEPFGTIEGLEDPSTGKRFTKYGFSFRHGRGGEKPKTPHEQKVESIRSAIAWSTRRLHEEHAKLAELAEHPVINWETDFR